jgi:predicted dithiol-disulfide oxidoreductase (DUF899 family)
MSRQVSAGRRPALTRRSDELARWRRPELPWVRIDKQYRFDTDEGPASLADLFRGRSQLVVYHFMFGPNYEAGCPTCSSTADSFNGDASAVAEGPKGPDLARAQARTTRQIPVFLLTRQD